MNNLRLPDDYLINQPWNQHWTDGPGRQAVIAIRAAGLTLPEIEVALLQTLALGRKATLDETYAIDALSAAGLTSDALSGWADAFAAEHRVAWTRRRLFRDLLFSLEEEHAGP